MSIDADSLIISKAKDLVERTEFSCEATFLGFLNEHELSLVSNQLTKLQCKFSVFGGYCNSNRNYIAILPEWMDIEDIVYPFVAIQFSYKAEYKLTHRDFLGTLMSLGIERSKIGDILVYDGKAICFINIDISQYCINQISKVGGVGVLVNIIDFNDINYEPKYELIRKTVASNRIDCVVSALCNCSRENANTIIKCANVFVNYMECKNNSFKVKNDDVLSIRGYGKYFVDGVNTLTKKGRIVLNVRKCV